MPLMSDESQSSDMIYSIYIPDWYIQQSIFLYMSPNMHIELHSKDFHSHLNPLKYRNYINQTHESKSPSLNVSKTKQMNEWMTMQHSKIPCKADINQSHQSNNEAASKKSNPYQIYLYVKKSLSHDPCIHMTSYRMTFEMSNLYLVIDPKRKEKTNHRNKFAFVNRIDPTFNFNWENYSIIYTNVTDCVKYI